MFRHFRQYNLRHVVNSKRLPIKLEFSIANLIATWFYLGLSPIGPGTLGSLGAYPVFYLALYNAQSASDVTMFLYMAAAFLFLLGWWAAYQFHSETMMFDHQSIVIDEVVGQLLTCAICFEWLFYLNTNISNVLSISQSTFVFVSSFLAFRYFDISKPLILGYIDRHYKSAFAVMLDDVIAALFAAGTIYIFCSIHDKII